MRNDKYILNEQGVPVVEPDLMKWGRWFSDRRDQRIVKQEMVGDLKVSTVFLGLDHNFSPKGPPVLWETMVFHPNPDPKPCPITGRVFKEIELDGYTRRCSGSREQAEAMHERMVNKVKGMK